MKQLKNLEVGYKLGDGTSGKVFLAQGPGQKSYALKQIKLKIQKVIYVNTNNASTKSQSALTEQSVELPKSKKKREKRVIFQKDYMREPFINRLLMIGPQIWHHNIVAMKNFYIDKSTKSGAKRLNLVLDYAKQGDLSKVKI